MRSDDSSSHNILHQCSDSGGVLPGTCHIDCLKDTLSSIQEYKNIDREIFNTDFVDRGIQSDPSVKPSEFRSVNEGISQDGSLYHAPALVPATNIVGEEPNGELSYFDGVCYRHAPAVGPAVV